MGTYLGESLVKAVGCLQTPGVEGSRSRGADGWLRKLRLNSSDQFFAAAPPPEALRLVLSEAAARPPSAAIAGVAGPRGRM